MTIAQRSWPFDDVGGDRPLTTEQWSRGHTSLSGNGVVPGVGSELAVVETSPESLAVDVSLGRCWVEGRLYEVHSEPVEVALATADATNPRIDRIVVRRSMSNREVTVEALTGAPAVDPDPPALTQNAAGDWEEPLARVFVGANASDVSDSDITDERLYSRSPLLPSFGWVPINSGLHASTGFFDVDVTAGGMFPAGTFELLRLHLRGHLDDVGTVWVRPNNDSGAGYITGGNVARASDGDVVDSFHNASAGEMRVAQWGTRAAGNTAKVTLYRTGGTGHTVTMESSGVRNADSAADHRFSRYGGRVNTPMLISSLRVAGTIGDATQFEDVRWWLEGYRELHPIV